MPPVGCCFFLPRIKSKRAQILAVMLQLIFGFNISCLNISNNESDLSAHYQRGQGLSLQLTRLSKRGETYLEQVGVASQRQHSKIAKDLEKVHKLQGIDLDIYIKSSALIKSQTIWRLVPIYIWLPFHYWWDYQIKCIPNWWAMLPWNISIIWQGYVSFIYMHNQCQACCAKFSYIENLIFSQYPSILK